MTVVDGKEMCSGALLLDVEGDAHPILIVVSADALVSVDSVAH